MYLTLTLNPSIDYYVRLPKGKRLETGTEDGPATNRSLGEYYESGGKGINIAKVLRRLSDADGFAQNHIMASGISCAFTGNEILRNLELERIDPVFIEVPGHTRINLKITDGLGIETEINGAGPAVAPGDISRLISIINNSEFKTLFISGSMPAGLSKDTYAVIAKAVIDKNPNVRIVVDCEGDALLACLAVKPFLIKPNAAELAALTGLDITVSSDTGLIKDAAKILQNKGAQNVLISCGPYGACLLCSNGDFFKVPGIKGHVISTIGAGDTMLASFIYSLDKNKDMKKALNFSNICAACSAFSSGLPSQEDLHNFIKELS